MNVVCISYNFKLLMEVNFSFPGILRDERCLAEI